MTGPLRPPRTLASLPLWPLWWAVGPWGILGYQLFIKASGTTEKS